MTTDLDTVGVRPNKVGVMHHIGREPQNPPLDAGKHIEVIVIPLLYVNFCFVVWLQCRRHDDLLIALCTQRIVPGDAA